MAIKIEKSTDAGTGTTYSELSAEDGALALPYFHREQWTAEDAALLVIADGAPCLFHLESGEVRNLNEETSLKLSHAIVSHSGRELFACDKSRVVRVELATGEASELHELSENDGRPVEISPSADGSGLAMMMDVQGLLKRVAYLDFASGKLTACCEGNSKLGHLQMSPTRSDLIMFADQHDFDNHQRIYTVLTNGRERFPFYRQRPGEWVTHECWSRDGRWVTFTMHPKGLFIARAADGEARLVAEGPYWHAQPSSGGDMIVADIWYGEIRAVRASTGEFKTIGSAWTKDGKWVPSGDLHAHPTISRGGGWLAYVQGETGKVRIRIADMRQFDWMKQWGAGIK
ncbi:MAG TPA: hypothetical protein PL033_16410 [Candidatus Brocadiia bacterium]|nr:hypothetical protein [Candidatus Brocadiia bacterium]